MAQRKRNGGSNGHDTAEAGEQMVLLNRMNDAVNLELSRDGELYHISYHPDDVVEDSDRNITVKPTAKPVNVKKIFTKPVHIPARAMSKVVKKIQDTRAA